MAEKIFHIGALAEEYSVESDLLKRCAERAARLWECSVEDVKVEFDGDELIVATRAEYTVTEWDTGAALGTYSDLKEAKSCCRKLGYIDYGHPKNYSPVAYVSDENGYCIYNPRFKK